MANRKLLTLAIISMMLISSFAFLVSMIPRSENTISEKASTYTTSYTNSDITSLWVRKNGTDPYPFNFYGGANVSPNYGMNYFSTNVIQVTWDYNFTEISDLALFPLEADIYIQSEYTASYYTAIADFALTDYIANGRQRIRGAFIDDFQVGLQSPTNMSSFYTALHHEDGSLAYDLTLGIVVYNRNYMNQNGYVPNIPYSWYEIEQYFEIVHFWYYPFQYSLLYNGLIGYEDDFLWLHNLMPSKEYWLGIYLHYYNVGSYDLNFTNEEMAIAGRLIKNGYAERYSLLENFWIQHNTLTALLIKNFINDQFQNVYTTTWFWGSQTVLSYSNGLPVITKLIINIRHPQERSIYERESWTFESIALQNLTVKTVVTEDTIIYNMRTGDWQYPYFDIYNETASYILEPYQKYRIISRPMTQLILSTNTTYTTPQFWDDKLVIIRAMIEVNNTNLTIQNCIVQFDNPNINNSMYHMTTPWYGLKIGTNKVDLFISDSILEPSMRAYPYYFNRPYSPYDTESQIVISNSVIAGYSYRFRPAGNVHISNSTFFQVQPLSGNYPASIWLECASYITLLFFNDNIVWNWYASGTIGVFLMAYNLPSIHTEYVIPLPGPPSRTEYPTYSVFDHFKFDRNIVVGGNYGVWFDQHYSDDVTSNNLTVYASTRDWTFVSFRLDGEDTKKVTVNTYTIFNWSVKSSIPGPLFIINYPYIPNGIYILTTDFGYHDIGVNSNTLEISNQNWLAYRNNYTLYMWGSSIKTEESIEGLIWLLFVFIVPISMTQIAPKIGFIFGMVLMLIIISFEDTAFLPYMFISLVGIAIVLFKGRI